MSDQQKLQNNQALIEQQVTNFLDDIYTVSLASAAQSESARDATLSVVPLKRLPTISSQLLDRDGSSDRSVQASDSQNDVSDTGSGAVEAIDGQGVNSSVPENAIKMTQPMTDSQCHGKEEEHYVAP